ncbi:hypothetical protein TNCV_1290361 [Trichonephila clavipes]|nr:hypothetical protein TNCV_1290361 [Trichonephila clavipes]
MDRCVPELIHCAFHNDERIQIMPGKHSSNYNAATSCLDSSGNGYRVIAFIDFTPYTPTSNYLMEHKRFFIGKRYLSPNSGYPVVVLACKFYPSLPMNSSQHMCMK